jgi:putative photosynthetic complex assembly protein 2
MDRPQGCFGPPGLAFGPRFLRAAGTVLYHEILLIVALLTIAKVTLGTQNEFGFWTFAILFFARISAKLNLFLGVPRIHSEFLPRALHHLDSHFRRAGMNALFPVSVTGSMCSRSTIPPCRRAPSGCGSRPGRCIPRPTSTGLWRRSPRSGRIAPCRGQSRDRAMRPA